jgi:DNA-binding NtrC family response regulator
MEILTMDEIQYQHARRVLDETRGNKLRAAKLLGISRMTLYRLLDRHRASAVSTGSPATIVPPVMSSAPQHASL